MKDLEAKIHAVEKHAIVTELGMALFVGTAQMILKLGIATVALTGGYLLAKGGTGCCYIFPVSHGSVKNLRSHAGVSSECCGYQCSECTK